MGGTEEVIINWFLVSFILRVNYMSANNNENIFTWIFDLAFIDPIYQVEAALGETWT